MLPIERAILIGKRSRQGRGSKDVNEEVVEEEKGESISCCLLAVGAIKVYLQGHGRL